MIIPYMVFGLFGFYQAYHYLYGRKEKCIKKIYQLIREDMGKGKFRNGLREQDIYSVYSREIDYLEDDFTETVLEGLREKLASDEKIQKAVSSSGYDIFKL